MVRPTDHKEASSFIRAHHYSKSCTNTRVYCFGLYREVIFTPIMGAAIWLPPLPPVAKGLFPEGDHNRVLALTRLAIHPDVPTNGASFLIGQCIKEIKRDDRYDCLVTYADTRVGHSGAIYKATNWEYLGETEPKTCWLDPSRGSQVSIKAGGRKKTRTVDQMEQLGYQRQGTFTKHRYRMVLR